MGPTAWAVYGACDAGRSQHVQCGAVVAAAGEAEPARGVWVETVQQYDGSQYVGKHVGARDGTERVAVLGETAVVVGMRTELEQRVGGQLARHLRVLLHPHPREEQRRRHVQRAELVDQRLVVVGIDLSALQSPAHQRGHVGVERQRDPRLVPRPVLHHGHQIPIMRLTRPRRTRRAPRVRSPRCARRRRTR